jgi:integrase
MMSQRKEAAISMPGVSASEIEPLRDHAHDQGAWMSSPPTPQVRSLGAGYWLMRNVRRLVRSPDGHTFASRLIQQGESLAYVRDQMGHHSIKITVDIYGHLVPGANKAAVDRLDDATGRNLYATANA